MIRRAIAVCAVVLTTVACSAPAADEPDPTPTPGTYTDAEQTEILTDSIALVYGTDPQPDWYPAFVDLTVKYGDARVRTTLTEADAAIAEAMCANIAGITFDDDAEPIGVRDVFIFGAGNADLADCDVARR